MRINIKRRGIYVAPPSLTMLAQSNSPSMYQGQTQLHLVLMGNICVNIPRIYAD